jgi:phosphoglycolate phosphatase
VSEFLSAWPFSPALGQREGVARKPDPAGVLEVCETLRVAPKECVYIGDSSVDMLTARNSGTLAVGVAWGFRPVEELVEYGAARILDVPFDLLELFSAAG